LVFDRPRLGIRPAKTWYSTGQDLVLDRPNGPKKQLFINAISAKTATGKNNTNLLLIIKKRASEREESASATRKAQKAKCKKNHFLPP
jgi:hypothetical protein